MKHIFCKINWRLCAGLLAGAVFAWPSAAAAQDNYPSHEISFVVPYSPGGLPDTVARFVAEQLGKRLKQSVVVQNKPGANGVVAANVIKTNKADGYTFLVTDGSMVSINPHIYKDLSYSPTKDFVPVSLIATSPLFLAANKSFGVKTFQEFVDKVKANPDAYTYGSSGVGSSHHLTMEALKAALKLQIRHVPYRGSGQSVPALVGDQVQVIFAALPSLKGFVDQGSVSVLASNSLKRSSLANDIPTISETVPGFDYAVTVGILARTGTPQKAIDLISSEVAKIAADPEFAQRLAAQGIEAVGGDAATYAASLREESDRYSQTIEHAHVLQNQ